MYVGLSTQKNTLNPFEPRQNFEHVHPEMGQKHLTNPGLSTQIPNFKSHELGLTPILFPGVALFELILLTMNCGQRMVCLPQKISREIWTIICGALSLFRKLQSWEMGTSYCCSYGKVVTYQYIKLLKKVNQSFYIPLYIIIYST